MQICQRLRRPTRPGTTEAAQQKRRHTEATRNQHRGTGTERDRIRRGESGAGLAAGISVTPSAPSLFVSPLPLCASPRERVECDIGTAAVLRSDSARACVGARCVAVSGHTILYSRFLLAAGAAVMAPRSRGGEKGIRKSDSGAAKNTTEPECERMSKGGASAGNSGREGGILPSTRPRQHSPHRPASFLAC